MAQQIRESLHLTVYTRSAMESILIGKLIATSAKQIGMFLAILSIVSAAIVAFIIYTLTMDKIREIAVLKLIGTRNRTIALMIVQQALALGIIGFMVGKVVATFAAPNFPKYVLLIPQDSLIGFVALMIICLLASSVAIRMALKVDPAKTDYQHWQMQATQHSLIGQWLLTAVLIVKADAQSQATQEIIALQEQQLSIAQQRERLGIGQEIDVIALQTQLAQTQSTLPALIKQQQQLTHLLAALSGSSASTFKLSSLTLSDFVLPTTQTLTLPSQLIQQRPDILASEALVKAAHAEHGLSLTRYYPNITLSASTGSQALTTTALFGSGTAIWSLMTQVTQPLFDASLPEQERAALLGFEAASLRYQQVILDAMRQVADSLSAIEQDQHTLMHLNQAEKSAQMLITITDKQYQLGTASYLQLLSAQQQLAQIRLQRIQLNAQQLINHINLALALG